MPGLFYTLLLIICVVVDRVFINAFRALHQQFNNPNG